MARYIFFVFHNDKGICYTIYIIILQEKIHMPAKMKVSTYFVQFR